MIKNKGLSTILMRHGSKKMIAEKILPFFHKHNLFVDMFFGAGGLFFKKKKAKFNICNDLNNDVYNLFTVLKNEETKNELEEFVKLMPFHQSLLKEYKNVEPSSLSNIERVARFLFLSNYTFMAGRTSMRYCFHNNKETLLSKFEPTFKYIQDVQFMCCDFRDVLKNIAVRDYKQEGEKIFVYADPPYLGTETKQYTSTKKWNQQDTLDLFNVLTESGYKFAISEFDNEFVMDLAKKNELYITEVGERRNLQNRRVEILITNYDVKKLKNKLF
ncbi:MAG: DNA adenine methylase [Firmicutes bacterium]|nr:DNA adenine methylase [Bacillota bacterium]